MVAREASRGMLDSAAAGSLELRFANQGYGETWIKLL